MNLRSVFTLTMAVAMLAACGTPVAVRDSRALMAEGKFEESVAVLASAANSAPADVELSSAYVRQRELVVARVLASAEDAVRTDRYELAQTEFERVLRIEPANVRARDGLAGLATRRRLQEEVARANAQIEHGEFDAAEQRLQAVLREDPMQLDARKAVQRLRERQAREAAATKPPAPALQRPVTIEFRDTPLRSVFEVLSRSGGVNFAFDREVKQDARVTLFVRNAPVDDVIRIVLATNQLDRKTLNDNTLLIYPATQAKQREYQELVTRSFFLVNADAKQVQAMLRTLVKSRDIYVDERLNMVSLRDTAEAVRYAERMVDLVDRAEPEVMLELEVIEISRSRAQELGLEFPTSVQADAALPVATNVNSGRIDVNHMNLVATIATPALKLHLSASDTDTNLLANPRIRAKNHEKAKVLIGEKLPVFTSTAVQNAGVSSSVSYIDVGLKLEVEPNIYLDDEVGIKVQLEVNSNLGEKSSGDGNTTAYRIGTRTAQTNLRLRDGETQVLAGLINQNESETLSRLPGLGDIPALGRLFSDSALSRDKTEIVLLITPRIVRNIVSPELAAVALASGTEADIGAAPLRIARTASNGFGVRSDAAQAAAAPEAAAAPATDAAATAGAGVPPVPALHAPEQVSVGKPFDLAVDLSAVGAVEADVVLSFDPQLLQAQGGSAGKASVHLSAAGQMAGSLNGSVSFNASATGAGSATVQVVGGSFVDQDGRRHQIGMQGSATVRIVQ
jgi:general secretion pathway protein D